MLEFSILSRIIADSRIQMLPKNLGLWQIDPSPGKDNAATGTIKKSKPTI